MAFGSLLAFGEDASVVPRRFSVSIGGFTGARYRVELRDGKLIYTDALGPKLRNRSLVTPSADQWREFRKQMDALKVWRWEKSYPNPEVQDGTQWAVDIAYPDQTLKAEGDNSYPDARGRPNQKPKPTSAFNDFLAAVRKLIGKRDFQ